MQYGTLCVVDVPKIIPALFAQSIQVRQESFPTLSMLVFNFFLLSGPSKITLAHSKLKSWRRASDKACNPLRKVSELEVFAPLSPASAVFLRRHRSTKPPLGGSMGQIITNV